MKNKDQHSPTSAPTIYRVGGVRFFNARPLLYQLASQPEVHLQEAPPARLADDLNQSKFHAALVPSIDYQVTQNQWTIVPGVAIGSTGAVLTVQVFSRVPFEQIDTLACDLDSHTSVILAQILFHHCFSKKLNIIPLTDAPESHDAVLLIGDKVLPHLNHWPHQLDLGWQWNQLTGLPFVYAFWALPDPSHCDSLVSILQQTAQQGLSNFDDIIGDHADAYGFTPDLARQYFTENLSFDFGSTQHRGLARFYELAFELDLAPANRPLNLYSTPEKVSL